MYALYYTDVQKHKINDLIILAMKINILVLNDHYGIGLPHVNVKCKIHNTVL